MKTITLKLTALCWFIGLTSFAQVGIGTSTPNGILDVTSNKFGIVYPSVALSATNVEAPVVNPMGGALAIGTTIYNTNTTNTGSKDVEPGIYAWDGSKWVTHFYKKQSEIFKQTSTLRTSSNPALGSYEAVPGLAPANFKTFTAKYSGLYRIDIKINYGGGELDYEIRANSAMASGQFRFIFDGTNHIIPVKSISTYNEGVISGGIYYSDIWVETYKTVYIDLVQGQTYGFSLEFDQDNLQGFKGDGNFSLVTGDGRGYVGSDIPCFVEFTYLDE